MSFNTEMTLLRVKSLSKCVLISEMCVSSKDVVLQILHHIVEMKSIDFYCIYQTELHTP